MWESTPTEQPVTTEATETTAAETTVAETTAPEASEQENALEEGRVYTWEELCDLDFDLTADEAQEESNKRALEFAKNFNPSQEEIEDFLKHFN